MFCPMCGKEIKDGSKFCSKCGARIENRQEPVSAGAPLSQAGQPLSHPAQPQQPSAQRPVQPGQSSVQPARRPAQPGRSSVQPAQSSVQPAQRPAQPGQSSAQPAQRPAQPPQSVQPPPPVQPPQSPAPPQPPEKKKKGGIIIIILAIVLVVLLAAGAGTLYYIKQSRDAKQQKIEAESRQAEEAKEKKVKEKKEQESREAESQAAESSQAAQEEPTQAQAGGKSPAAAAPATCTLVYGNQADFSGLSKISIQKGNVTQSSNIVQKNNPNIDNTGWSAFDGVLKTSWQEGAAGNGLGEYVSARFDQVYQVKLITFDLGNHRSGDWYYKNNRPRVLGITLGGQSFHVEFPDEMTEYAIIFSEPISATDLTITIEDIYPGTEYSDTTISEIGVYSN